jgi:hypothetical protein
MHFIAIGLYTPARIDEEQVNPLLDQRNHKRASGLLRLLQKFGRPAYPDPAVRVLILDKSFRVRGGERNNIQMFSHITVKHIILNLALS